MVGILAIRKSGFAYTPDSRWRNRARVAAMAGRRSSLFLGEVGKELDYR